MLSQALMTKHGQKGAQLVRRDGAEDLAENVRKTLHGERSTVTWRSFKTAWRSWE